jgi:hypothetical protein
MSHVKLSGSCLCDSVRYTIEGEVLAFNHCHCSRCRKATGTGHASNIILKPSSVEWPAGEDLLTQYKVPEAKRFATVFCRRCGSLMPRIVPDMSLAVIAAGTLDHDPGIEPERHIFEGSRAEWSCSDDGLPSFEAYPPAR